MTHFILKKAYVLTYFWRLKIILISFLLYRKACVLFSQKNFQVFCRKNDENDDNDSDEEEEDGGICNANSAGV